MYSREQLLSALIDLETGAEFPLDLPDDIIQHAQADVELEEAIVEADLDDDPLIDDLVETIVDIADDSDVVVQPPAEVPWNTMAARGIMANLEARTQFAPIMETLDEETRVDIIQEAANIIGVANVISDEKFDFDDLPTATLQFDHHAGGHRPIHHEHLARYIDFLEEDVSKPNAT